MDETKDQSEEQTAIDIASIIGGNEKVIFEIKNDKGDIKFVCESLTQDESELANTEIIARNVPTENVAKWNKEFRRIKLSYAIKEIKLNDIKLTSVLVDGKPLKITGPKELEIFLASLTDKVIEAINMKYENELNTIYDFMVKKN
jgi:hypothetical protein